MPHPQPTRVIFTADDFGRSQSINRAVIESHRGGVLTAASLMVTGEAFEEAVQLSRQNPQLGVGLHLTLVQGQPALPPEQIPGLTRSGGRFTDQPVRAGWNCFFNRSLRTQIESELGAQFERFHATGLPLDHVNGHLNFHLHPVVFDILMRRRKDWGIRHLRWTRDPLRLNAQLARGQWIYRLSHALIFHLLCLRSERQLRDHGIGYVSNVFGLLQNGRVDEQFLLGLLPRLKSNDFEIYSHPSLDLHRHEFDALMSQRVVELTKKLGIQCCRYQDL